jgi:integrase/recombinase XerD
MWHRFLEYLHIHRLEIGTVQAENLVHFLDGLEGKSGKPAEDATRRRYLKLLSAVFEHLNDIGVRQSGNPCTALFRYYKPVPDKIPAAMASQADERFVAMVLSRTPRSWRDYRDQAMMLLIIGSGLYTSEVINLEMEQLVLDADPPYLHIAAHGKVPERKAPIISFAREPLRRWLEQRAALPQRHERTVFISGKGGKLLPATLYRKVQSVLKAHDAALHPHGGYGPQVLRNSFLMRQLAKDKPVEVVQQWAGHVETKSTLRFRRLVVNPGGIEAE